MKVLLLAISQKFPLWEECLNHNVKLADVVIIRVDKPYNNEFEQKCKSACLGKHFGIFQTTEKEFNKWNWREELLTNVHSNSIINGEYVEWVLFPDEDEKLPLDFPFPEEKGQYMFDYEMVSDGTHRPFKYPALPHAKIFTYDPFLTYNPYFHFARVGKNKQPYKEIASPLKIQHYCFFKEEWMEEKERSITERYPDYFKKFPKTQ